MAWQDIAKNVAPVLAGALPPPFNAMAAIAVKAALGLSTDAKEKEVERALASASPETLLKLKEAENAFLLEMEKLDVDLERIHAGDRDSARKREAETKDKTPLILAMLITAGFFCTLGYMMIHGLPEAGRDALLIMLGALGTAWGNVVNYYFGSSAGSKQKSDLMAGKQ